MPKPRKSVPVKTLVERANHALAYDGPLPQFKSDEERQAYRMGICSMLECVLHAADAYAGFYYLESAGLERHPEGHQHAGFFKSVKDESRRRYGVRE